MRTLCCLLVSGLAMAAASDHRIGLRIGAPLSGDAKSEVGGIESDIELDGGSTVGVFYEYHGADRGEGMDAGILFQAGLYRMTFEPEEGNVDLEHTYVNFGLGLAWNITDNFFLDIWPQASVGVGELDAFDGPMSALGLYVRPGFQFDNFFVGLDLGYEYQVSEIDFFGADVTYTVNGIVGAISVGGQF